MPTGKESRGSGVVAQGGLGGSMIGRRRGERGSGLTGNDQPEGYSTRRRVIGLGLRGQGGSWVRQQRLDSDSAWNQLLLD